MDLKEERLPSKDTSGDQRIRVFDRLRRKTESPHPSRLPKQETTDQPAARYAHLWCSTQISRGPGCGDSQEAHSLNNQTTRAPDHSGCLFRPSGGRLGERRRHGRWRRPGDLDVESLGIKRWKIYAP